jgi:ATP-dependent exoDNAse (exonuclease V) alpha subunit
MLIANVNVSDGLSNGVIGTVRGIIEHVGKVVSVQVQFENPTVGRQAQDENAYRHQYPRCVDVQRLQITFAYGKGRTVQITRSQYSLTLAFGCTIHKVQGLTLEAVVISMHSRFGAGQAYVAMSRVRTLQGLHFLNFDARKIVVSKDVVTEMNRLQKLSITLPDSADLLRSLNNEIVKIVLLNVRSLHSHRSDVINDTVVQQCDIICLN